MAIDPIKIFQGGESSLANIFQSGSASITSILDKAVQIGRDISNKQMRQEEDLLSIRQQETALQQRRAENLSQDWEDVFRFAENKRQFDTKFDQSVLSDQRDFAANRQDTAWTQQRTAEQDILRGEQWNKQFGLQESSAQRENRRLSLAEDRVNRQDTFDQNMLKVKPEQRSGLMGIVDTVASVFGGGQQESPGVLAAKRDAAVRQGDAATAASLTRQLDAIDARKEGQLTTAQRLQQQRYEQSATARQKKLDDATAAADEAKSAKERQKQLEDAVLDREAFPGRAADLKANAEALYGKAFAQNPKYIAQLSEAENIDKNRLAQETVWAKAEKSADDYANLLKGPGATPAALERRRRFWRTVNGVQEGSAQPTRRSLGEDFGF